MKDKNKEANATMWETTEETMTWENQILYRVKATADFSITTCGKTRAVKAGELGGWINEPHEEKGPDVSLWIGDNAKLIVDDNWWDGGHERTLITGEAVMIRCIPWSGEIYMDGASEAIEVDFYQDMSWYKGCSLVADAKAYRGTLIGSHLGKGAMVCGDTCLVQCRVENCLIESPNGNIYGIKLIGNEFATLGGKADRNWDISHEGYDPWQAQKDARTYMEEARDALFPD